MNRNSSYNSIRSRKRKLSRAFAVGALASAVIIAGCSGEASSGSGASSGGGTGSNSTVSTPQVGVTMVNAANQTSTINAIGGSQGVEGLVLAKFVDSNGHPIPNAFVQFSVPGSSGSVEFKDSTGAAVTDQNGVASVKVSVSGSASKQDAVVLTATATLPAGVANSSSGSVTGVSTGAATFSGTTIIAVVPANASVTSAQVAVAISPLKIGVNPLGAYGSTNISVDVAYSDGSALPTPATVSFSSACASRSPAKAFIDSSATTINGTATVGYRDFGCAGTDTITATVSGLPSKVAQLNVAIPALGALQFSGTTASNIALKGVSGGSLPATAQLSFTLLDQNNQPLQGKEVQFSLDSSLGNVLINPTVATTDASGKAYTTVSGGSQPTTVSVLARASGSGIQTQSSQLTISTGLAAQRRFSIAATQLNIEGYNIDGVTSTITASAYDNSGNPVPDGTAVLFVSSAAGVGNGGASGGQCLTNKGRCSVTFTSAGTRPDNGRVEILAYTVGEESFVDANNDGLFSNGTDRFDAVSSPNSVAVSNTADDIGDAFLDEFEVGHYTVPGTSYPDPFGVTRSTRAVRFFNLTGASSFVPANGAYDGTLQTSGGSKKYVFQNMTLVLSTSGALVSGSTNSVSGYSASQAFSITDKCVSGTGFPGNPGSTGGSADTYFFKITDQNGNVMPAGTEIKFSTSNGELLGNTSFKVGNTSYKPGTSANSPELGNHSLYPITIRSDAEFPVEKGSCLDGTGHHGHIRVDVTTPSPVSGIAGSTTTAYFPVED